MISPPAPSPAAKVRALALDYGWAAGQILSAAVHRQPDWAGRPGGPGRLPILLVPGIYESWRFLAPLGRLLHQRGHRVDGVELGLNAAPLADGIARLARALPAPGEPPVILVAHSKGGLVGRGVLLDHPDQVAGLVGVNTPFAGSSLARWLPTRGLRPLTPAAMAAAAVTGAEDRIISVAAGWDPHIPEGSALPGADHVVTPDLGHFRPLHQPGTQLAIVAAVHRLEVQARTLE